MWPFRNRRLAQLELEHDERVAAEFWFDRSRDVVSIFGTKFTSIVLRQFRVSSDPDECYNHVRRGDVVLMTRTVGHRTEIRALRELLEQRPQSPENLEEWRLWSERVRAVLPRDGASYAREGELTQQLVLLAIALRHSAKELDNESPPEKVQAQLQISGQLIMVADQIESERRGPQPAVSKE